jgi:hypothetical protein
MEKISHLYENASNFPLHFIINKNKIKIVAKKDILTALPRGKTIEAE